MTLIEMMVTMAVAGILTTAVIGFIVYTTRGFAGMMNYVEMEAQSRAALDSILRDVRQAVALSNAVNTSSVRSLTFGDVDSQPLTYTWSLANRTLTRTRADGSSTVLLSQCDNFNFSLYKRNTTNQTYNQYPTSVTNGDCKVIQITWLCSRTNTGVRQNNECVQTAKIVMRNQQTTTTNKYGMAL